MEPAGADIDCVDDKLKLQKFTINPEVDLERVSSKRRLLDMVKLFSAVSEANAAGAADEGAAGKGPASCFRGVGAARPSSAGARAQGGDEGNNYIAPFSRRLFGLSKAVRNFGVSESRAWKTCRFSFKTLIGMVAKSLAPSPSSTVSSAATTRLSSRAIERPSGAPW